MSEKRDDVGGDSDGTDGGDSDGDEGVGPGDRTDADMTDADRTAASRETDSTTDVTTDGAPGELPPESDATRRTDSPDDSGDLFVHGFVGAAATVLLGFVPFSPVLGGALAGYLHGRDGLSVGTVAGVIAAIPAALLLLLVLGIVGFGTIVADQLSAAFFFAGLFFVSVLILLVYVVGLSALGGLVGVELSEEFER
jgi:hypothetical protein